MVPILWSWAFASTPECELRVLGEGDVKKVGAGVAAIQYGIPDWTYVWDYEGSARSSYEWNSWSEVF